MLLIKVIIKCQGHFLNHLPTYVPKRLLLTQLLEMLYNLSPLDLQVSGALAEQVHAEEAEVQYHRRFHQVPLGR